MPLSKRAIEGITLLNKIKLSKEDCQGIFGSPRIHNDYRKVHYKSSTPANVTPNWLRQVIVATSPDEVWVTDITQIYIQEGWLYLAAVIDLYSRAVVGWSMQGHIRTELVLDAMLMAKWRRQPKQPVVIHSDQGSQFGSDDFNRWCKENHFLTSMSRRGNCHDNAAMESFFSSLKKEKARGKTYNTREELKAEVYDYIEVFYNKVRRHSYLNYSSPVQIEQQRFGHWKMSTYWGKSRTSFKTLVSSHP